MQALFKKIHFVAVLFSLFGILLFTGCDEEEDPEIVYETGTLTDMDGNVYTTIKIGTQWWMAENLKVTHFRNGMEIPLAQDSAAWSQPSAARCLYDNNATAPGLLYNWAAVSDTGRLAPEGWHIPSDAEWKQLETHLGMDGADANQLGWRGTDQADELRVESPLGWTRYGTVWSSNDSRFNALAGSCRLFDGTWGDPGLYATGFWWSSSDFPGDHAWYRHMDYKKSNVFRSHVSKRYGMSVRCVKD